MSGNGAAGASYGDLLVTSLLALAGVCVVAFIGVRLVGRLFAASRSRGAPLLDVIARLPLEPRRSLYVVDVAGKALLIGTSEMGLSVLSVLDHDQLRSRRIDARTDGQADGTAGGQSRLSFAELVRAAWLRRRGFRGRSEEVRGRDDDPRQLDLHALRDEREQPFTAPHLGAAAAGSSGDGLRDRVAGDTEVTGESSGRALGEAAGALGKCGGIGESSGPVSGETAGALGKCGGIGESSVPVPGETAWALGKCGGIGESSVPGETAGALGECARIGERSGPVPGETDRSLGNIATHRREVP